MYAYSFLSYAYPYTDLENFTLDIFRNCRRQLNLANNFCKFSVMQIAIMKNLSESKNAHLREVSAG